MANIIIPIVTALLGMLGGLLVARSQARSHEKVEQHRAEETERNHLSSLALEIAKLEFERAEKEGRQSQSSVVAHWAVLRALIEEHGFRLADVQIPIMVEHINLIYGRLCWTDLEMRKKYRDIGEFLDAVRKNPTMRTKRDLENIRSFLEAAEIGVDWEIITTSKDQADVSAQRKAATEKQSTVDPKEQSL